MDGIRIGVRRKQRWWVSDRNAVAVVAKGKLEFGVGKG